jgi:hypothetical protein
MCRSCRATRCLVTELPTALETMKPTRTSAASWVGSVGTSCARWATTRPPGARRPRRTVVSKSRERVMRAEAGSTTSRIRLPVCRGPCGGAKTGSTDRRAYACAGGSRASCDAGGCWAGKCASLGWLHVVVSRGLEWLGLVRRSRYRERRHRECKPRRAVVMLFRVRSHRSSLDPAVGHRMVNPTGVPDNSGGRPLRTTGSRYAGPPGRVKPSAGPGRRCPGRARPTAADASFTVFACSPDIR